MYIENRSTVKDRQHLSAWNLLCFHKFNFYGMKFYLGTKNQVLASENLVPENLPILLAIDMRHGGHLSHPEPQ